MNEVTPAPTANTPVRRRKSSGLRKAIVAGVVLAAAGGGWYGWSNYKASKDSEGEYITAKIERGDIEDLVTSTGTLQPRDYVDVGAQVSGQIETLFVEVGDVVKKGDKLASIDAETSQAKMEQSEASLATSKNSLETQKENLKKTERDFLRQKALYEQDATTKQSVMDAETSFENAKRQIRSSELDISGREASMRIDKKNLAFTTIAAPIDGTVMKISVKEGQTVNASQNVPNVMQIANLNTMTVQAEVSEADVAKLYPSIPVYFTTLGEPTRRWYGALKRTEPTPKVQNSVVLYNALFDVQNEGNSLKPQMTAQVYFVSAEARNVLMLPMAAIQQGQQIARELAQKEREKNAAAGKPGATGAPAGAPGAMPSPPTIAANASAPVAGAPVAGTPPSGPPRGANGPGGFNPENMTPEQREQFARMRAQGGGFPGGGNFGGQRGGGANGQRGNFGAMAAGGAATGPRPAQRRNGIVMVKKPDGTLEQRRIVYGVTNRVHGEVLEGLKEGEEVVVGKREKEAAAAAPANQGNRGNQPGLPGGLPGGGFPGGGPGGGGGGGGRPF